MKTARSHDRLSITMHRAGVRQLDPSFPEFRGHCIGGLIDDGRSLDSTITSTSIGGSGEGLPCQRRSACLPASPNTSTVGIRRSVDHQGSFTKPSARVTMPERLDHTLTQIRAAERVQYFVDVVGPASTRPFLLLHRGRPEKLTCHPMRPAIYRTEQTTVCGDREDRRSTASDEQRHASRLRRRYRRQRLS